MNGALSGSLGTNAPQLLPRNIRAENASAALRATHDITPSKIVAKRKNTATSFDVAASAILGGDRRNRTTHHTRCITN